MSEQTTQRLSKATLDDFNELKSTRASTMSFDEFLRVLMTVYRAQAIQEKQRA